MKIYKITFNKCDYDQYDGFVVRAKDQDDVIEILRKEHEDMWRQIPWREGYAIKEVDEAGEPEIIIGSYNAG